MPGGKKKKPKVEQVAMNIDSLCTTDCYVLDKGSECICFRPEEASVWEKRACNDWVNAFWDLRNGRMDKYFIDLNDECEGHPAAQRFWELVNGGVKPETLPEESVQEANRKNENAQLEAHVNKIYNINNDSGVCQVTLAQSG